MTARDLPACTCGSTTPGAHGLGCPRAVAFVRVKPAHVIGAPDRVRTARLPRFDADEAADAWIAEMRGGRS